MYLLEDEDGGVRTRHRLLSAVPARHQVRRHPLAHDLRRYLLEDIWEAN